MALTLPDDRREFVLGSGAAGGSILAGVILAAVAVSGRLPLLEATSVVAIILLGAFVYGIGGLYDIVALGIPKRGVAHLVTGAGFVLVLLAPHGNDTPAWFVASGALALLLSGGYHAALVANVFSATEEPATDLESDGDVS